MKKTATLKLLLVPVIIILMFAGCKKSSSSSSSLPLLSTTDISAIDSTTATGGGNVFSDGGEPVTARGICWSVNSQPSIVNSLTSDGVSTGVFTSSLSGLAKGTRYYVRAYATNINGTAYGSEFTFITLGPAVLVTVVVNPDTVISSPATNVGSTTATLNGSIDSGFNVVDASFDFGVTTYFGASVSATLKNLRITKSTNSSKSAQAQVLITADISGLMPYTTYYFRAKVVNSTGSFFGSEVTFMTTY